MIIQSESDLMKLLNILVNVNINQVRNALIHSDTAYIFATKSFIDHYSKGVEDSFGILNTNLKKIVFFPTDVSLLTEPLLLRLIKVHSPIEESIAKEMLKGRNISFDDNQLSNMLDNLRKKDLILRSQTNWCITLKGLNTVPRGRNKNSSDISRAVVLAKRNW